MGKNVHVTKHDTRWWVKQDNKDKPESTHRTQELAINAAIPIAKNNKSDVVIHDRNNKIRDRDSYGNDPCPPKDKKH